MRKLSNPSRHDDDLREPPADPRLETLLDQALGPRDVPPDLVDRVMRATEGELKTVAGRIPGGGVPGRPWWAARRWSALAAAVLLAASLTVALWVTLHRATQISPTVSDALLNGRPDQRVVEAPVTPPTAPAIGQAGPSELVSQDDPAMLERELELLAQYEPPDALIDQEIDTLAYDLEAAVAAHVEADQAMWEETFEENPASATDAHLATLF